MNVVSAQTKKIRKMLRRGASSRNGTRPVVAPETMVVKEESSDEIPELRKPSSDNRKRSSSAPPGPERKKLIEDYYRVDTNARSRLVVLPGLPKQDDDWSRDLHDFFNLIVLVPVVVLNLINWNWDMILDMPPHKDIADAWTGEWFSLFFGVTTLYFCTDLIWILLVPTCVRSPATIIQHHIATLVYLLVPYSEPQVQWAMGACMSVEINTWFLIARRVFNKQGFSPWVIGLPPFVSIRVKLISIFFYLTWISIRCILYPYLLVAFFDEWQSYSMQAGTSLNVIAIVVPLHAIFCLLNAKWTYDLIMSKLRYWRRKGRREACKGL
jgi:hypothetical protein